MSGMGIPIDGTHLFTLQYADDQVVIAQDKFDLEYMTRKLIETYEEWNLKMNIKKIEYMCVGEQESDLTLDINILMVTHFKFLDTIISSDTSYHQNIRERIVTARSATSALNGI